MSVESERAAYDRRQRENDFQRELGRAGTGNPFNPGNIQGRAERENARTTWQRTEPKRAAQFPSANKESTPRGKFCALVGILVAIIGAYWTNHHVSHDLFQTVFGGAVAGAIGYVAALIITSPLVWGLGLITLVVYFFLTH